MVETPVQSGSGCREELQALRNIDRLRVGAFAAEILLLILAIGLDALSLLVGAILLGVSGLLLHRLRRLFFVYDLRVQPRRERLIWGSGGWI